MLGAVCGVYIVRPCDQKSMISAFSVTLWYLFAARFRGRFHLLILRSCLPTRVLTTQTRAPKS